MKCRKNKTRNKGNDECKKHKKVIYFKKGKGCTRCRKNKKAK